MCRKPRTTRRYCTKCKMVTSWRIDSKLGHSRCMVCKSDSLYARKQIKRIKEEPKMNKQYVKEQIDIAINGLRKEYDAVIKNIYQCPDCGALAFRSSEHVCLGRQIAPAAPRLSRRKIMDDYVLEVLQTKPPADLSIIFENDSPYLHGGICRLAVEAGFRGKADSPATCLAKLGREKKLEFAAVLKREIVTNNAGKTFDRITPGLAYWRSS